MATTLRTSVALEFSSVRHANRRQVTERPIVRFDSSPGKVPGAIDVDYFNTRPIEETDEFKSDLTRVI